MKHQFDYRMKLFNVGPYNDVIDKLKAVITETAFVFDDQDDNGAVIRWRCDEMELERLNEIVRSAYDVLKGYHRIAIQRRPAPPPSDILVYNAQFYKGEVSQPEHKAHKKCSTDTQ